MGKPVGHNIGKSGPVRRLRGGRHDRGQALVELALIVPVLMVLAVGALDFGMAFYTKVVMENSAREGAYYMVYNTDHSVTQPDTIEADVKNAVVAEAGTYDVGLDTGEITVACDPSGCPAGSTGIVTVEHPVDLLVDVIFHGPITVTSEARMLIP